MNIPNEILPIARRFAEVFPLWLHGNDDERKIEHTKFCQQVVFETGNRLYGTKRASPTRPLTKDALALKDGNTLHAWDLVTSWGTLNFDSYHDITDQVFVEVSPVNHLGSEPIPGPEPGPEPGDVIERLARIEDKLDKLMRHLGT